MKKLKHECAILFKSDAFMQILSNSDYLNIYENIDGLEQIQGKAAETDANINSVSKSDFLMF